MAAFVLDLDAARDILIEEDAVRLDREGDSLAPILGDNEVTRYWPEIQPDIANQCVAYLESYAAAKNNSKQRYIDNPLVSGEVKPGRWRQARVYVEMIGDVARVVQVLRRGWRTSLLLNGTIDFTESRVMRSRELEGNSSEVVGVDNTESDNEEKYLLVRFPNVSNAHIKSVMTELRAVGLVTNLTINGENYGSNYRKLFATCNIDETDGSMQVDVLFAESQYTINSYNSWGSLTGLFGTELTYLWGVPKELAQNIIDDYRALGAGRGATASYSSEQGVVDIILNAKRRDSEGNLVKVPFETGIKTMQLCSGYVYSFYYFDVEDPDASDYVIGDPSVDFPSTDGVTYRKTVRSNNDDTYDVVIEVETEVARNTAISDITISKDYFTEVVRSAKLGTADALADLSPAAGTAATQQITIKDNCRKNVVTDVELPTSRQWTYDFETDYGTTTVYIGRNCSAAEYAAILVTAALAQSDTNTINKVFNRFGLIDYEITKRNGPGGGDAWIGGNKQIDWEVTDKNGVLWHIYRKWFNSASSAETFLGTSAGGTIRDKGGSHVTTASPASRGRIVATRVEYISGE